MKLVPNLYPLLTSNGWSSLKTCRLIYKGRQFCGKKKHIGKKHILYGKKEQDLAN